MPIRLLFLCLLTVFPHVIAASQEKALLVASEGSIEVQRSGASSFVAIAAEAELSGGDTLKTGETGRATVTLSDGTAVRVGPKTILTIRARNEVKEDSLFLKLGRLFFLSREPEHVPVVLTPHVSAAIRGTELSFEVSETTTRVAVLDGVVECSNQQGAVTGAQGEEIVTEAGSAPTKALLVNPRRYVQWVVHAPRITAADRADPVVARAAALLSGGELPQAEHLLNSFSGGSAEDRTLAQSLRSILHTVRDESDSAIREAEQAVGAMPNSATARIALSYALQGAGRIEDAYAAILPATAGDPDALTCARAAELSLALNRIDDARSFVACSLRKDSSLVYAHVTNGFLKLIENEPREAEEAFARAIVLDASYPYGWLGHGLSLYQLGNSVAAQRDFQIAVTTGPTVSVLRSYFGKLLFEIDRPEGSAAEFERAIALDPNDPTPFLYRAFDRLSRNDPVGALDDITESIDRNDARAVFRSGLLLDQDLATRESSLAQVYSTLGFSEVARLEASLALNEQYGNYSAHRFLADAYDQIIRTDASLSERVISNLLAPLGFETLQPSQPASLGEYSSLLEKEQDRVGVRSLYDSRLQSFRNQVYVTGRSDKWGYVASTDALVRSESENSSSFNESITELGFQYQPQYDLRFITTGGLFLREASPGGADDFEAEIRFFNITNGVTYRATPDTTLILTGTYQRGWNRFSSLNQPSVDVTESPSEIEDPLALDLLLNERYDEYQDQGNIGAQAIHEGGFFSLVTGVETLLLKSERSERSPIVAGEFELTDLELRSDATNRHGSFTGYSYFTAEPLEDLDVTLGVSYAFVDSEDRDLPPFVEGSSSSDAVLPKFGITYRPDRAVTFRTAYFESFGKAGLKGVPSIEPTLVGSINQLFFDNPDTYSRNVAAGIDLQPFDGTYLGTEWTHRNLKELTIGAGVYDLLLDFEQGIQSNAFLEERSDLFYEQDLLSAYLYQVLSPRWIAALNYRMVQSELTDPLLYEQTNAHNASLGVRWFDPSGLFATTSTEYLERFADRGETEEDIFDHAVFLNASLGYRFPRRHGTIEFQVRNILDQDIESDSASELDAFLVPGIAAVAVLNVNF